MPRFASTSFTRNEILEIIAKAAAAKLNVPWPPNVKVVEQLGHERLPHALHVILRDGYDNEAIVTAEVERCRETNTHGHTCNRPHGHRGAHEWSDDSVPY